MGDEIQKRNILTTILGVLVAAAALVAFGSLLYGLASGARIDADKVERLMRERIPRQTELPVTSVECPKGVHVREGLRFECQATLSTGRTTTIEATQVTGDGDLRIRIKPGTVPLDAPTLEASLKQRLIDDQKIATKSIKCPNDRYQKAGETLTCTAVDNNDRRGSLDVVITTDSGDYRYLIRQN